MESQIGELVQESGLKKIYIAKQLEVTREQVSRWVSGKSYPRLDKAFELAELLSAALKRKVLVDDLYKRSNSASSK
jgi:putative transcriptional regulator